MVQWYSLLAPEISFTHQALLESAGRCFLNSGIQEPSGGVARYHLCDSQTNARVSNEITGYAASMLAWLYDQTGNSVYLDAANRAGRYLMAEAWDHTSATFPYEPVSEGA